MSWDELTIPYVWIIVHSCNIPLQSRLNCIPLPTKNWAAAAERNLDAHFAAAGKHIDKILGRRRQISRQNSGPPPTKISTKFWAAVDKKLDKNLDKTKKQTKHSSQPKQVDNQICNQNSVRQNACFEAGNPASQKYTKISRPTPSAEILLFFCSFSSGAVFCWHLVLLFVGQFGLACPSQAVHTDRSGPRGAPVGLAAPSNAHQQHQNPRGGKPSAYRHPIPPASTSRPTAGITTKGVAIFVLIAYASNWHAN